MVMKWFRTALGSVLMAGPIPQHLAFIMDGNRRFADRAYAGDLEAGHTQGFSKLLEALEWCLEMGIKCVSVFAFSIDNFNRSPKEVGALMKLAEVKLNELAKEHKLIQHHDIRVQVIGDLSLLPLGVQQAAARVMQASQHNKGATLNICLAYSSTQEAVQALRQESKAEASKETDLPSLQHMYTKNCPPVDLLVRTSGESRLSDFLLWQSSHALLHFSPVLWPDFSFVDFLRAITSYQRSAPDLEQLKSQASLHNDGSAEKHNHYSPVKNSPTSDATAQAGTQQIAQVSSERLFQDDGSVSRGLIDTNSQTPDTTGSSQNDDHMKSPTQSSTFGQPANSAASEDRLTGRGSEAIVGTPAEVHGSSSHSVPMPARRNARLGLDRRKQGSERDRLLGEGDFESGLFARPAVEIDRGAELRAKGFAGGYDSMDDDEDEDSMHVNGCPCCIVKFLPMHQVCTDPTPAVKAMRGKFS